MGYHNEKVNYWVELADYDLKTAEAMLETERLLYVGFMCHQTLEKILKAYYVSKLKDKPPYTHNLSLLADRSKLYDELSEEQKDLLDTLEPLNIEARYPTDKEKLLSSLNYEKCKSLILGTRRLKEWIKNRL